MKCATREIVRDLRDRWLDGQPAHARSALVEYPELASDGSAFLSLAYEEFCMRRNQGEEIDLVEFCDEFPEFSAELLEMLLVHFLLDRPCTPFDDLPPLDNDDCWPQPRSMLFDCVLIRLLGVGAFSRVYLARETTAGGRPVVLKVSRLPTGEAARLGVLSHPHIVEIHWARRDPVSGWYVTCMPFVGAATLTHVIRRIYPQRGNEPPMNSSPILDAIDSTVRDCDPRPIRSVAGSTLADLSFVESISRLGQRLAETLEHLHGHGYAHGDLKPANVLLARGGRPLLLDFNLSRGGTELHDRVGGTFPYMAPEHLESFLSKELLTPEQTSASDVFSLGVILYELLTGQLPFGEPVVGEPVDSALDMFEKQSHGYLPIRDYNPAVTEALADSIDRCLSRDPADRPSAATLAAALAPKPKRMPHWLAVFAVLLLLPGLPLLGAMLSPLYAPSAVFKGASLSESEYRERGLRALREARTLRENGKTREANNRLAAAESALGAAIEARTKRGEKSGEPGDYFARGQVQLLLGEVAQAKNWFNRAHELHRKAKGGKQDGPTLAYLAYCATLSRDHAGAIRAGEQALEAGHRTPALLNNLAYSRMQSAKDLPRAKRCLMEAIRRDPNFAPAYRNRALLAQREHPDGPFPEYALTDIDRAIELHNRTKQGEPGGLCSLAVSLYASAAGRLPKDHVGPERARYRLKVIDYLERAASLGVDVSAQGRDLNVAALIGAAKVEEIARKQKGVLANSLRTYLAEPVN